MEKESFTARHHLLIRVPIILFFIKDLSKKNNTGFFEIITFTVVMVVLFFPYLDLLKLSKKEYLKKEHLLVLGFIGILAFVVFGYFIKDMIIPKIILLIYTTSYLILDKFNRSEKLDSDNESSKMILAKKIKLFLEVLWRYIYRIIFMHSFLKILTILYNNHSFVGLLSSFFVFFATLQLFFYSVRAMQIVSGLEDYTLETILLFFLVLGMFNPRWWEGISILVSLLGLALSNEFLKKYTNVEMKNVERYFYQIIIPYISLLVFLSLTISYDIISIGVKLDFLNSIPLGTASDRNDIFILSMFTGAMETAIFISLWYLFKRVLKSFGFLGGRFFRECSLLEEKVKNSTKKIISTKI